MIKKRLKLPAAILAVIASSSYANDSCFDDEKSLPDVNGSDAGEWTITRLVTNTNKHGEYSGKMRIEKSAGSTSYPYCGPVDIRIEGNTPIRLLKTSEQL